MPTDKEFIVYKSPSGKLYTKPASVEVDDKEGKALFKGSHEACMDYLFSTPETIIPKTTKRKAKAPTKHQIAKLVRDLDAAERKKVEAYILRLKAKRS